MVPVDDVGAAAGYEADDAVVGDDDGEAVGVCSDEAVGGAVARADGVGGLGFAAFSFDVEGLPDGVGVGEFAGDFSAEADEFEAFVEDDGAVDGGEAADEAADFEDEFSIWLTSRTSELRSWMSSSWSAPWRAWRVWRRRSRRTR
ncbi:MAG: hypothetical protein QM756_36030 [Polyangiaceae bacterium]